MSLFPQGGGFGRAYIFQRGDNAATYGGAGGYARFREAMITLGVPAETLASATPAGPLASFIADDSWIEQPACNGFALVGDAAGISDPTWGMGMSLALKDARTLTGALLAMERDIALRTYAEQRDAYFTTVITAESWQTDLQLTPGEEAARRRAHAMALWRGEPERALDLPELGPDLDVSARARARFYGDDVPAAAEPVPDPAAALLAAVRERDFTALRGVFGEGARLRALLPGGPNEFHGAVEAAAAFERSYANARDFKVIDAASGQVGDRLQVRWRCSLRWPDEEATRVIEQVAYAKAVDGRIVMMDLLCSGFRPAAESGGRAERAA